MTTEAAISTIDWKRARRALRRLVSDPERTSDAIEVIDALSGPSFERAFARFAAHPDGQKQLRKQPSLLDALRDRERLAALPEGSLGRAYLARVEQAGISAEGLVAADEEREREEAEPGPEDPDREFFGSRIRDAHDLWHVATGYGMDDAGEAAVLAFSHGQNRMLGFGVLALAAAVLGPRSWSFEWERYLLKAWRRGRRAHRLDLVEWERLLPEPLSEVRRSLAIEPPERAHPDGIVIARLERFPAGV